MLVVTDEELESVAPEMTRDIDLRRFVPLEEIAPPYFQRPYFLAPAGKSQKAYRLLARTLKNTARAGIGTFVMRGHQYLVAILSDGDVLRAQTLRFAGAKLGEDDVRGDRRARARFARHGRAVGPLCRGDPGSRRAEGSQGQGRRGRFRRGRGRGRRRGRRGDRSHEAPQGPHRAHRQAPC